MALSLEPHFLKQDALCEIGVGINVDQALWCVSYSVQLQFWFHICDTPYYQEDQSTKESNH